MQELVEKTWQECEEGGIAVIPLSDPEDFAEIARIDRTELLLGTIDDMSIRIQQPFVALIHTEDGRVTLEVEDINEFGFGHTLSEARDDLQRAIRELVYALEADAHRLGPDLQATRERLLGHVRILGANAA